MSCQGCKKVEENRNHVISPFFRIWKNNRESDVYESSVILRHILFETGGGVTRWIFAVQWKVSHHVTEKPVTNVIHRQISFQYVGYFPTQIETIDGPVAVPQTTKLAEPCLQLCVPMFFMLSPSSSIFFDKEQSSSSFLFGIQVTLTWVKTVSLKQ